MNRDSNFYTFMFASILVVVVAITLAFTATSLKSKQQSNINNEKMQNILSTIGIQVERDSAKKYFDKYIVDQVTLDNNSEEVKEVKAFNIELSKEIKKPVESQFYPLYIAYHSDEKYYVIPLRGAGLWNAIWGYVCMNDDLNTIKGVVFDHAGETAGLGAEITQKWFQQRFEEEKIFDEQGEFVGVTVMKGNNDLEGKNKDDHRVDAISGATITGNGVSDMLKERISHYVTYFKKLKNKN